MTRYKRPARKLSGLSHTKIASYRRFKVGRKIERFIFRRSFRSKVDAKRWAINSNHQLYRVVTIRRGLYAVYTRG